MLKQLYSQKEFEPLAWDFYKCIFEICNGKNSQEDSRKFHSTGLRPKFKPRNVRVLMRRNTKLDQEWYSVMVHDLFYHVSEMTAITLPLVLESQGYVNSRELILKYDQQPELYQPTRLWQFYWKVLLCPWLHQLAMRHKSTGSSQVHISSLVCLTFLRKFCSIATRIRTEGETILTIIEKLCTIRVELEILCIKTVSIGQEELFLSMHCRIAKQWWGDFLNI